jgi:hypothetical protein
MSAALYGVDQNARSDRIFKVPGAVVTFHLNGVPTFRCEYEARSSTQLPDTKGVVHVELAPRKPLPLQPPSETVTLAVAGLETVAVLISGYGER